MADIELAEHATSAAGDWHLGPIIDADAHIDPPYSMWRDYLAAHLKDRGPQLEERVHGEVVSVRQLDDPLAEVDRLRAAYSVPHVPGLPAFTGGLGWPA